MTIWFVSSAILADLSGQFSMTPFLGAALSSSVQCGFVAGALALSVFGVADRFDPRRVFSFFACAAGLANVCILFCQTPNVLVVLRLLTGISLAGVYPVGLKIAVGWGTKDRGWLVGCLVGGLTLGSAAPHLLSFLGGANWRLILWCTSGFAFLSSLIIYFVKLGPHHSKAAKFDVKVIKTAFTDSRIRRAYLGYFGHMWELLSLIHI